MRGNSCLKQCPLFFAYLERAQCIATPQLLRAFSFFFFNFHKDGLFWNQAIKWPDIHFKNSGPRGALHFDNGGGAIETFAFNGTGDYRLQESGLSQSGHAEPRVSVESLGGSEEELQKLGSPWLRDFDFDDCFSGLN